MYIFRSLRLRQVLWTTNPTSATVVPCLTWKIAWRITWKITRATPRNASSVKTYFEMCRKHLTNAAHREHMYSCDVCFKEFRYASNLVYHKRVYGNDMKFTCEFCLKGFYDADQFESHVNNHCGEGTHACSKCDTAFASKPHPKQHEKQCNTREAPIVSYLWPTIQEVIISLTHLDAHKGKSMHVKSVATHTHTDKLRTPIPNKLCP